MLPLQLARPAFLVLVGPFLSVSVLHAQESLASLKAGDVVRIHEMDEDSVSGFWLYPPIKSQTGSFEARLGGVGDGALLLHPKDSPGAPRRIPLADIKLLEVHREDNPRSILWGLAYGTVIGAILGYSDTDDVGDHVPLALTAWGAGVGTATGALASSRSRGRNALWGLAAGGLMTLAVVLAGDCEYACGMDYALVGLGAGIGSGIGALIPPRRASWKPVRTDRGPGG